VVGPSRRSVLAGSAALALGGALGGPLGLSLSRAARAQGAAADAQTRLKVAAVTRIELGGQTPLALFQNLIPGPVLRVKRGDRLAVSVENTLETPLSLNWQGVRVPNALDGVPGLTGTAIAKGGSADIAFTAPDAGTYLYRAFQPELAHRALAGALIVTEEGASPYAADHVMLIQSWAPDPTMKVPLLTVNGAVSPTFEAPAAGRVRLRLINAGTHFLRLKLDAPCYAIAIDGQPVQVPFLLKDGRAQLTPGGRLDLALDVGTADPIPLNVETSELPVQLALVTPVGAGTADAATTSPPVALPSNGLPENDPAGKRPRGSRCPSAPPSCRSPALPASAAWRAAPPWCSPSTTAPRRRWRCNSTAPRAASSTAWTMAGSRGGTMRWRCPPNPRSGWRCWRMRPASGRWWACGAATALWSRRAPTR